VRCVAALGLLMIMIRRSTAQAECAGKALRQVMVRTTAFRKYTTLHSRDESRRQPTRRVRTTQDSGS